MLNRRAYIAESAVTPGCAVVQGSADNKVKAPANNGAGDFIGVFSWEANEAKVAGDEIGIVLHGLAKVAAGGNVAAGKPGILKGDASGTIVALPATAGNYKTVGIFLEGGSTGEYVDFFVERGSVTV